MPGSLQTTTGYTASLEVSYWCDQAWWPCRRVTVTAALLAPSATLIDRTYTRVHSIVPRRRSIGVSVHGVSPGIFVIVPRYVGGD